MSLVFVVDQERRPQRPVHPGTARWLLSHGKAAVLHRAPFTLILKQACLEAQPEPLRLKLDPGSKTTGLAVVNDGTGHLVWAAAAAHAVSGSALSQPQEEAWLAAAFAPESGAERDDVGGAAAALVSH
jgi:hypothetical protein